ncbi:MAG: DedA family protein [Isosphaeraceae bacterium]
MAEELIGKYGYVGIALILILGGLGLPIPEEVPIIIAAVLSRNGQMAIIPAFASCMAGVLLGDLVVYLLGYFYGEKVLKLPLTRRLLTRQREAQIKGYFHRHGFKILVSGRFVPGFRTAAYLTAGILKLPALKLLVTDLVAATLSTTLMFGLGYLFAYQIRQGIHEAQQGVVVALAVGIAIWLLYRFYRARQRAGLPVGPPVLADDEAPLPLPPPEPSPSAMVAPDAPLDSLAMAADAAGILDQSKAALPPHAEGGTEPPRSPVPDADGPRRTALDDDPLGIGVEARPGSTPVESPSR